ncbi:MAG: hypothetical protein ACOZB3_05395 [Calditrichota bacterium]
MNVWTRLALFTVAFGLLSGAIGCGSKEIPDGTLVTILYSNDVRGKLEGCGCRHNGGGITRRSAEIAQARETDPTVVYCDAGNFLTGTAEVDSTKGLLSVDVYNHLKATVANVSERELAFGMDAFNEARKHADFAFVSANLRYKGSSIADPYVVRNVKEAKVGFIGLCGTKEVMRYDSLKLPEGISVENPLAAARREVAALKGKAHLIIVLSTCGDKMDSLIAQQVPGITAIVGGRTYRPNATEPWTIGPTRVLRTMRDGRTLGRLDLVFGGADTLKTYRATEISMEASGRSDPEMLALIRGHIPSFIDNPTDGVRMTRE